MPSVETPLLRNLLLTLVLGAILYLGRSFLIPVAYSMLLALVLYPVVVRVEGWGWPRWSAILLALMLVVLVFVGVSGMLVHQLDQFVSALPRANVGRSSDGAALWGWLRDRATDLLAEHRNDAVGMFLDALPGRSMTYLTTILSAVFDMVLNLFLIPILTALLLFHRGTYVKVLVRTVGAEWAPRVPALLRQVITNYARFIGGMVQVYLVVAILNTLGLLLLGVPHAMLFGPITAVATIIPYVGIILSSALPIAAAYSATGEVWMPIAVIAVLGVVQYLEANLIFPKLVGAKLGLTTLASLLIILAGGLLWGMAGMILFLPLVSILLLVTREVPEWAAVRLFLSGEDHP